jgi:hypothetical protein
MRRDPLGGGSANDRSTRIALPWGYSWAMRSATSRGIGGPTYRNELVTRLQMFA